MKFTLIVFALMATSTSEVGKAAPSGAVGLNQAQLCTLAAYVALRGVPAYGLSLEDLNAEIAARSVDTAACAGTDYSGDAKEAIEKNEPPPGFDKNGVAPHPSTLTHRQFRMSASQSQPPPKVDQRLVAASNQELCIGVNLFLLAGKNAADGITVDDVHNELNRRGELCQPNDVYLRAALEIRGSETKAPSALEQGIRAFSDGMRNYNEQQSERKRNYIEQQSLEQAVERAIWKEKVLGIP